MLNVEKIIADFCSRGSRIYNVLLDHGTQVAKKSIEILDGIPNVNYVSRDFIVEASMLHDIGVCMTSAKSIGCLGSLPYLCHGFEGRKILDRIGLHKHGLVCERHIGVGLSSNDIIRMNLPLPVRDMVPISLEEKLICYSDKFFSKGPRTMEKDIDVILNDLTKHGIKNGLYFLKLHNLFTGRSNLAVNQVGAEENEA